MKTFALISSLVFLYIQLCTGRDDELLEYGQHLLSDIDLKSFLMPPNQLINCTTPGAIYPVMNGCNGWYQCGINGVLYRNSCGARRCYNATSNRCNINADIDVDKDKYWFNCTAEGVPGVFAPWKQNPQVYGFCISEDVVLFLNYCPQNSTFSVRNQTCQP